MTSASDWTDVVEVRVTSGPMAARCALGRLMRALEPLSLKPHEADTVELVLAEALNNIVEHAYPPSDPAGPIVLSCRHRPNGLNFLLIDKGRPMPAGGAPSGRLQSRDVQVNDLPEGGFGWFLIRDLASDVQYSRVGGYNWLTLCVPVDHIDPGRDSDRSAIT